jgi:hypothetical protein
VDGVPAGRRRLPRESVAGHRRNHDVERVRRVAAVCRWVAEWTDHVQHLDEGAGPAVRDDQRQGVLVRRLSVDEVDVEPVDLGDELRVCVQPRLEPPEVVVGGPIPRELLDRRQRHALRLIADGLLLGPARRMEPPAEVVDLCLGDLGPEGPDGLPRDGGWRGSGCDLGHLCTPAGSRPDERRMSIVPHQAPGVESRTEVA